MKNGWHSLLLNLWSKIWPNLLPDFLPTLLSNLLYSTKDLLLNTLFPKTETHSTPKEKTHETLRALLKNRKESKLPPWLYTLFPYHHPLIRQLIWNLKYKGEAQSGRLLGAYLYETIVKLRLDIKNPDNSKYILTPIPLSRKRLKERGFNQTRLLIEEVKRRDTESIFQYAQLLKRERDNVPQTSLSSKRDRTENMKNAFSVISPHKVKNRNCIIIDDVTTTGSTLKEARKALKRSGARKVIAVALAH